MTKLQVNEKMKNKEKELPIEFCLMVHQVDDGSEKLCFPDEDESEPVMISDMKNMKLGGDYESSVQSLEEMKEDNEPTDLRI